MSRVRLLVATVTAVFTCLSTTLACSCRSSTREDIYCRSDYAIVAKVIDKTVVSTNPWFRENEYKLELLMNYKPSPEFNSVRQVIQANDADISCGVDLSTGSTYLLMGHFTKDWNSGQSKPFVLDTSLCNMNIKLDSNPAAAVTEAGNVMSFLDGGNFRCDTRGRRDQIMSYIRSLMELSASDGLNADTNMK